MLQSERVSLKDLQLQVMNRDDVLCPRPMIAKKINIKKFLMEVGGGFRMRNTGSPL